MPFAGYKNFADCVKKNSSKKDPQAYCATIMRATEEVMDRNVHELVDVQEATFHKDETTGKMSAHVVIIKAGRAKNPRRYRAAALQKAAKEGVYNGLRMFVNHSDKPPLKREFNEMVSAVESTTWDPRIKPEGAIVGEVEFFDEKFFEKAQSARKYIGLSADHRIRVNHVQEGRQSIEDVTEVAFARSVDWVLFPSAGGEILSFAREAEGDEQVEWSDITLEQLKENLPDVLAAYAAEIKPAKEGEEGEGKDGKKPPTGEVLTAEAVAKLVQEQVQTVIQDTEKKSQQRIATSKKVRELVSKSGLPTRTQSRIINAFEGELEFDEKVVQAQITDAKEELKEAGAGPRITGMGPTRNGQEGDDSKSETITVKESVEASFGIKKATKDASGKES